MIFFTKIKMLMLAMLLHTQSPKDIIQHALDTIPPHQLRHSIAQVDIRETFTLNGIHFVRTGKYEDEILIRFQGIECVFEEASLLNECRIKEEAECLKNP